MIKNRKDRKKVKKIHRTQKFRHYLKELKNYCLSDKYKPITIQKLKKKFSIPSAFFSQVLQALEKDHIIQIKNGKVIAKTKKKIRGIFHQHPKGFGFVIPIKGKDVFIPKRGVDNALDKDEVEVEILAISPKGPEGIIINVLKRKTSFLIGTVCKTFATHYLIYVPSLGEERKVVLKTKKSLSLGDRIKMEIKKMDPDPQCQLIKIFGPLSNESLDTDIAIEEYRLPKEFSSEAIDEAVSYGIQVEKKECLNRKDYTDLNTITIDPQTAKDFDDALSITLNEKGVYTLGVHIADVAHYVKSGSALNKEAFSRGNSTYFPHFVLPMLPHELSSHLCSLRPNVIRLTISVLMEYDAQGKLLSYHIDRSFIRSKKRFTYQEAKEVLDGKKRSQYKKDLQMMVKLCCLLQQKRKSRGSVEITLPEIAVHVNEKGKPIKIEHIQYDITHQLVEEFMLKANEIIAIDLAQKGKNFIYRIHEEPSAANMQEFFLYARSLGFSLPQKPQIADIQKLFAEAKDSPFSQKLSIAYIRSMKLAFYSPKNIGHYGLALEHYTHFTSPIRRYTDLIIERLLFDEPTKEASIKKIAHICSEKERNSMLAETSVTHLKKLRYLSYLYEKDPQKTYMATITKIKPKYFTFELEQFGITGTLSLSDLRQDFYVVKDNKIVGRKKKKTYYIGEKITLKILDVDLIYQRCDYQLVEK